MNNIVLYNVIYSVILSATFYLFYKKYDKPFIDEIFHIPQAQKYCNGNFHEWDSKITTLPGLYIFAVLLQPLFKLLTTQSCTVLSLRCFNLTCNIINMLLIHYVLSKIHRKSKSKKDKEVQKNENTEANDFALESFVISLFPLLSFYSVLFYTDPGSVLFVLCSYLACLNSNHKLSAIFGLFAILFRQTNIIWILFMAGITAAEKMLEMKKIEKVKASSDIKDKLARFFVQVLGAAVRYLLVVQNIIDIILLIWPYIMVIATFSVFLLWNGGITVGDKSSHEATFHVMQIFYFLGLTLFFGAPFLLSLEKIKNFVKLVKGNPYIFVIICIFCLGLTLQFSYVHLYLLSDNRHYVFYIWRWFLSKQIFRITIIPIYIFSVWSINDSLNVQRKTELWKLVFSICCMAATIPQLLVEVRYFIIPYLILRMNIHVQSKPKLILELLSYCFIHIFTVYVFMNKTFYWKDINQLQTIIW